jgi:hypothetical protein
VADLLINNGPLQPLCQIIRIRQLCAGFGRHLQFANRSNRSGAVRRNASATKNPSTKVLSPPSTLLLK